MLRRVPLLPESPIAQSTLLPFSITLPGHLNSSFKISDSDVLCFDSNSGGPYPENCNQHLTGYLPPIELLDQIFYSHPGNLFLLSSGNRCIRENRSEDWQSLFDFLVPGVDCIGFYLFVILRVSHLQ